MYSKQEVKKTRELFYTSFGKYMGKNKSIHGKRIKWVNYPTHVRHIYVRLFSNSKMAKIYIELQHKDDEIRSLYFEQFKQLKSAFENCVGSWIWIEYAQNELNQSSSRIEKEIQNVNILKNMALRLKLEIKLLKFFGTNFTRNTKKLIF